MTFLIQPAVPFGQLTQAWHLISCLFKDILCKTTWIFSDRGALASALGLCCDQRYQDERIEVSIVCGNNVLSLYPSQSQCSMPQEGGQMA